jgi:hypothetical protein
LLAKQTGLFLPTRAEVKIAGELSTHFPKRLSLPSSLPTAHPSRWPWRYLGLLTLVNLALRWSAIAHPSELVFDEVYYAQFGLNYLQDIPFFDVHPPLGKYLVAISIGLFYRLFPGDVPLATLTAAGVESPQLSLAEWGDWGDRCPSWQAGRLGNGAGATVAASFSPG